MGSINKVEPVADWSCMAQRHNHTLTLDLEPDLPEILADRERVLQVIMNIVSNSIKYWVIRSLSLRITFKNRFSISGGTSPALSIKVSA